MTKTTRDLIGGVILALLILVFITNLLTASTQAWYAFADHAPLQSILATFLWHLIHGV